MTSDVKVKQGPFERTGLGKLLNLEAPEAIINMVRLSAERIQMFIRFSVSSPNNSPVNKPKIIMKMNQNEKMIKEFNFDGDCNFSLYYSSEENDGGTKAKVHHFSPYEKTVSFDINYEQFSSLLKADMSQILIQTNNIPVRIQIKREDLQSFVDFDTRCFKAKNKQKQS